MLKLLIVLGCLNIQRLIEAEVPNCFAVENNDCPNSNITFRFYNSDQQNGFLINSESLQGFEVDGISPLKVIIHGFKGSFETTPSLQLLPELVKIPNVNVIVVDYSNLAKDPCYTESVHNAHLVGRCIGYFLADFLTGRSIKSEKLHLIGFGIGAHVAAFAANYLTQLQVKVPHITALDPAKPLYLSTDLSKRLDPSDADFVDVIHTDILIHGLMQPVGHVDFYPNKGVVQPNCGSKDDIATNECYHARSAVYYAESINSPEVFWAFRCNDLYGFIVGECMPNNNVEQLGYFTRETARGSYFLTTNGSPPYSKGKDFRDLDRTLYGKSFLDDDFITQLKMLGPGIRNLTSKIGK